MIYLFVLLLIVAAIAKYIQGTFAQGDKKLKLQRIQKRIAELEAKAAAEEAAAEEDRIKNTPED